VTALTVAVGLLQLWLHRFDLYSNDTVAYLDISDAVRDGNWSGLVNGYWSPLYPILLGFAFRLPWIPQDQFLALHCVDLILFCAQLAAFEFFLRSCPEEGESLSGIQRALSYGVLLASTLFCLPAWYGGPDALVAIFLFCIAGLSLRRRRLGVNEKKARLLSALIGLCYAFGYLAKTIFFPIALGAIFVESIGTLRKKKPFARLIIFVAAFLIPSAVWIGALTELKGYLTFGETGRLNYMWFVSPCKYAVGQGPWLGECDGVGSATHPPIKVSTKPNVIRFDEIFPRSTEPFWYDPSYWQDGYRLTFSWKSQFEVFHSNAAFYAKRVLLPCVVMLALVLIFSGRHRLVDLRRYLQRVVFSPPVWISVIGFGIYFVFMHMGVAFLGMRYIAAFLVLVLVYIVCAEPRLKFFNRGLRLQESVLVLGCIAASVYSFCTVDPYWHRYWTTEAPSSVGALVKEAQRYGLKSGDSVAASFYEIPPVSASHIARMGGLKITAMIDKSLFVEDFADRFKLYKVLKKLGVKAIISGVPVSHSIVFHEGWIRLGETGHGMFLLEDDSKSSPAHP